MLLIDQLIDKAKYYVTGYDNIEINISYTSYLAWKVCVAKLLANMFGQDDVFYVGFKDIINHEELGYSYTSIFESIIELLSSLRELVKIDYISNLKSTLTSCIFNDFMITAANYLASDNKDPAALLLSSVFESLMKKLALSNNTALKGSEDVSCLTSQLYQKKIINDIDLQQLKFFVKLRNSAFHAKFEEYTIDDVNTMLVGLQSFISKHINSL